MSSSVPVPSKGALRALRHLALGTSCTVALSAGLLTEDRRRRIHAARAIQQNGEKIKSSKAYHVSSGADAIAAFEEHVLAAEYFHEERHTIPQLIPPKANGVRKPRTIDATPQSPVPNAQSEVAGGRLLDPPVKPASSSTNSKVPIAHCRAIVPYASSNVVRAIVPYASSNVVRIAPVSVTTAPPASARPRNKDTTQYTEAVIVFTRRRDHLLSQLQTDTEHCEDPDAELLRLQTKVEKIEELNIEMTKLYSDLSRYYRKDLYEPIMELIYAPTPGRGSRISEGIISESVFYRIKAVNFALYLLESRRHGNVSPDQKLRYLNLALRIFKAPFPESPRSKYWGKKTHVLAKRLLNALVEEGRKREVLEVCATAIESSKSAALSISPYSPHDKSAEVRTWESTPFFKFWVFQIQTANEIGKFAQAVETFVDLYAPALLRRSADEVHCLNISSSIYDVVNAAVESSLRLRKESRFASTEKIIDTAGQIALKHNITMRAAPLVKLLGESWRANRNLDECKALFDRLAKLFDIVDRPSLVRSALIQCYLEAGKLEQAEEYLRQNLEDVCYGTVAVETRGHLAHLAAIKGEWSEAQLQIAAMIESSTWNREAEIKASKAFNPIFGCYVKAHKAHEAAQFLKWCVSSGLRLPQFASNTVIRKLVKSRDFHGLSDWTIYAKHHDIKPDSSTLNAMAAGYSQDMGATFDELLELYKKWQSQNLPVPDDVGMAILKNAASRQAGKSSGHYKKLLEKMQKLALPKKKAATSGKDWRDRAPCAQMEEAIRRGRYQRAVNLFCSIVEDGSQLSCVTPRMVGLAVNACFNLKDAERAASVLQTANEMGIDIASGVSEFVQHRVADKKMSAATTRIVLYDCERAFKERGVVMQMSTINHVVNLLLQRDAPLTALAVWEDYCERYSWDGKDFSVVDWTILLKIHIYLKNTGGIEYIMETVSRNEFSPDDKFEEVLRSALTPKEQKKKLSERWSKKRDDSEKDPLFVSVLQNSLRLVCEKREHDRAHFKEAEHQLLDIMSEAQASHAQLAA